MEQECRECGKIMTLEEQKYWHSRYCTECLKEFAKQGVDDK
jgi:hypothetical protein